MCPSFGTQVNFKRLVQMIHLDTREGGPNCLETVPRLLATLSSHRLHPPVTATRLHAGDFMFTGLGPTGPCSIGLERKRIPDFFHSLHSGRLVGEQLPKLIDLYDFCYLVLEGQAKVDWDTGELQERWNGQWRPVAGNKRGGKERRQFTGEEMLGAMQTIGVFTPVRVVRTFGVRDTLDVVATLWHWFQTPWERHRSHRAIYTPQTTVSIGRASTVRRVAAQLAGVGWDKSGTVEQRFASVAAMCEATVEDWGKLPGFGKVLSKQVVEELAGMRGGGQES